ncbi:MAG TPA: alpha/beta fold hydrolase [Anaerolineales bacterium]|nr:alpha/beta fold hydrolase [Anaerolineales bacterium]
MSQIIPTAEPFFLLGDPSKPACLLIHGFTGTPKEMRGMGEYLHRQGYTCLGIRLAGHATDPEDMIRARWTDWTASVEDGFQLLRGISPDVFLIGLSMGGILSLLTASTLPVRGVIAMSTPARLPTDYPVWLIEFLSRFIRFRSKSSEPPGSGWFDKTVYHDHIAYPRHPVRAAAELKKLILEMLVALPKVTAPVLLMHSQDERYVLPDNLETIYAGLVNTTDKTRLYLTGSGHVLPRDASREQVFQAADHFIQRVCS